MNLLDCDKIKFFLLRCTVWLRAPSFDGDDDITNMNGSGNNGSGGVVGSSMKMRRLSFKPNQTIIRTSLFWNVIELLAILSSILRRTTTCLFIVDSATCGSHSLNCSKCYQTFLKTATMFASRRRSRE